MFAPTHLREFAHEDVFRKALHDQSASTELVDAEPIREMTAEGVVSHPSGNFRLTKVAFGQLCHLCKLPVSYVEALARRDEALALRVVSEALMSMLCRAEGKVLVVDTRENHVQAIVDRESYNLVSNETVLDLALSAGDDVQLNRAFLEGPNARITVVDHTRIVRPQVGDVVRAGTDLTTHTGSENIVIAQTYTERLKCKNGLVAREKGFTERISARTDVCDVLPDVILRAIGRSEQLGPLMMRSATTLLDEKGIDRMTDYLQNPKMGGSHSLLVQAVAGAQREAQESGRDSGELSVWDFVNGVTDAAKTARSLNRRIELEAMGYRLMADFARAA